MTSARWLCMVVVLVLAGCASVRPGSEVQGPAGPAGVERAILAPLPGDVPAYDTPPWRPAEARVPRFPVSERILDESHRILANVRRTKYSNITRVDEAAGLYETVCSGLVRYVLRRISPAHLKAVVDESGRRSPRAAEFYDVFRSRLDAGDAWAGWAAVPRLQDARPGDLIAWRRETLVAGESTGHIMILVEPPAVQPDGLLRLVVFDSSTSVPDAAPQPAGDTGLGLRVKWFRADAQGAPVAYSGAGPTRLRNRLIAIGRAVGTTDR